MLKKKKHVWTVSILTTIWLTGCSNADLEAIRTFAASHEQEQVLFDDIADDFLNSCIRRFRRTDLGLEIAQGAVPLSTEEQEVFLGQLDELSLPPELRSAIGQSIARPDQHNQLQSLPERRQVYEAQCYRTWGETANQLGDVHAVMIAYMKTLGDLADGNLTDYSGQFATLQESIASLGQSLEAAAAAAAIDAPPGSPPPSSGFDVDEATGAVQIAQFLIQIFASGYQREQLAEAITTADPNFQKLVQGLRDIINDDYIRLLEREQRNLDSYYGIAIQRQLNSYGRDSAANNQASVIPLVAILVDENWRTETEKLDLRKQQAQLYVAVLEQIADTHHQLSAEISGEAPTQAKLATSKAVLRKRGEQIRTLLIQAEAIRQQLAE